MIKKQVKKTNSWVKKHRFKLLITATVLVLILASLTTTSILGDFLFISSMSFLFIQSLLVSTTKKSKQLGFRYFSVVILLIIIWLEPAGLSTPVIDGVRLIFTSLFFVFVTFNMIIFITKSDRVDVNVILAAINIYLLLGIIAASLAYFLYTILPSAYNLPDNITDPEFVHFIYFSFVTMSTLGYGDITPTLPQTQTLSYIIAVTGQLYVAIIIAILVGKLLMHRKDELE